MDNSPVSAALVADLTERADGLWEFRGETIEQHVDVFLKIDSKVNSAQWAMAAIAASVETKYGEGRIEEFATNVHRTPRHIRRMARTYREAAEKGHWCPDLTFQHHTEAISHPDPDEALNMARDLNLSSIGLHEWIETVARDRATKPQKASKKKRQNEFREFLERVDNVILTDFMATCPNAEWGRRVFKGWREDVTWELSQVARAEAAERVGDAVEQGAHTIPDIKSATGLATKDIEGVIGAKVAEGLWEWVREGGETDVARGSRRAIVHVIGAPIGR